MTAIRGCTVAWGEEHSMTCSLCVEGNAGVKSDQQPLKDVVCPGASGLL